MFTAKKKTLFKTATTSDAGVATATAKKSSFKDAAAKKAAETTSLNGAKKYATTGNPFIDQFGQLGGYKTPRTYADIAADCELLWATGQHRLMVVMTLYIRMITRIVTLFSGVSTAASQRGGELRHEGIMRMIWLQLKSPSAFEKNIGLFVSVGSWKDIFTMLQYDLAYNGWDDRKLNWNYIGNLLLTALKNPGTSELVKKYLPQIKTNSACKTVESQADNMIGKWICSLLFGPKETAASYKAYRKLKSGGTAHQWQQLISQRKFDEIDFNTIHGRALKLLSRGKFLDTSGQKARYESWISAPETEAKFTGFVHELFNKLNDAVGLKESKSGKYAALTSIPASEAETINKQFATLVKKGGSSEQTSLIVVRDTSGSMENEAEGTGMSCYGVAKAIALYFSEFLKGEFADSWIEFNTNAKLHKWIGKTPLEKWYNDRTNFVGTTHFQSVIELFIDLKSDVTEEDFPKGILCISDGEFNPGALNKTNVEDALERMRKAGFSKEFVDNFVIVLWNVQHKGGKGGKKFETYGNEVPNVFFFSGYSASTVAFLTSKIRNQQELFDAAMDQEILKMVDL